MKIPAPVKENSRAMPAIPAPVQHRLLAWCPAGMVSGQLSECVRLGGLAHNL
jgi:hypothetical protein